MILPRFKMCHPLHRLDIPGIHLKVRPIRNQIRLEAEFDARVSQPLSQTAGHEDECRVADSGEAGLFGFRKSHAGVCVGVGVGVGETFALGDGGFEFGEGVGSIGGFLEEVFGFAKVGWETSGVGSIEVGNLLVY